VATRLNNEATNDSGGGVTTAAPPADGQTGGRSRGARRRVRRPGWNWMYVIFFLVAAILAYEILVPLVVLVWASFSSAPPGSPDFFSLSTATLDNYGRALGDGRMLRPLWNTGVFATGLTVLGIALGGYLAWLVERTNIPLRGWITALCVFRLIIPGILTTVSWIFLASPSIGMINHWAATLFGIDGPIVDVYNMWGMIWVEALDVFPMAYLLMAASLRSMDPSLEEASLAAGRGTFATARSITLPLIRPALLATAILTFIRGIETFENPALIGLPAGIRTVVIEVWLNTTAFPTDFSVAGVYAVLVLVFCAALVWLYNIMTRDASMFAVISGKGFRPRRVDLGRLRWPALASAMVILTMGVILPLAVIVWASFSPGFGGIQPIGIEGLSELTLANYQYVLDSDLTRRAFFNSTLLGVGSATIVVILISITAWITVKTKLQGRQYLDHLAFAPIAIPSAMLGVAFLWFYLSVPIPVYNTLWILLLLYIAKYTAVTMRILSASMTQIGDELVDAAYVTGASWWRSFRTVTIPLLRPGLLAAWIFVVIHAFRELSASVFVYSTGNEPIGVAIFQIWDDGNYGELSALGTLALLALILLSLGGWLASRKFGVREG